jgi:uncharacterized FlaG/YvyC family protein
MTLINNVKNSAILQPDAQGPSRDGPERRPLQLTGTNQEIGEISASDEARHFRQLLSSFPSSATLSITIDNESGNPIMTLSSSDGSRVILQVPSELSLRLAKTLPLTNGILIDTLT